jgi:uncharacterized membrane protein
MSLESGRKLGLAASLIYVIMPVVAILGVVVFIVSLFTSAATEIGTGTVTPTFLGFLGLSAGFFVFLIAIICVSFAGLILFMVAMHRLSNYYGEPSIFKNVLYAFIINIITGTVIFVLEFAFLLSSITRIPQASTPSTVAPFFSIIFFIFVIIAGLAFAIVNGVLYMRAFNKLKEKSGVDNFGTAGILYLVGTIIPLVGWIAWIFAAMGFNKLKPTSAPTPTFSYPTQPPPANMQTKSCPYCGTYNAGALYCTSCGKPLQ